MLSSSNTKPCAYCSEHNASQSCAGCNDAPNPTNTGLIKTLYCNEICQKSHWEGHKKVCKAHRMRKVLYRAGETAQMAFYIFREKTYDQNITRVEKKENSLFLYDGYYDDDKMLTPFIPFPHNLITEEQDKQAALTFLTCGDAVAYMHDFFKIMLKGTYSRIAEIRVKVQPPKRPLNMVRPYPLGLDTNDYWHEIMQVTLKSGEVYAVDLTGAQHGYYDSVYLWDQYLQTRIRKLGEILAFGASKVKYCGAKRCDEPGFRGAVRRAHREFAGMFDRAVDEWQGRGVKVVDLLGMGDEEFVKTREELLVFVAGVLQDFRGSSRW